MVQEGMLGQHFEWVSGQGSACMLLYKTQSVSMCACYHQERPGGHAAHSNRAEIDCLHCPVKCSISSQYHSELMNGCASMPITHHLPSEAPMLLKTYLILCDNSLGMIEFQLCAQDMLISLSKRSAHRLFTAGRSVADE